MTDSKKQPDYPEPGNVILYDGKIFTVVSSKNDFVGRMFNLISAHGTIRRARLYIDYDTWKVIS